MNSPVTRQGVSAGLRQPLGPCFQIGSSLLVAVGDKRRDCCDRISKRDSGFKTHHQECQFGDGIGHEKLAPATDSTAARAKTTVKAENRKDLG